MDSRRWGPEGAQREDQFTRAPSFRDAHESDHLRETAAARWFGRDRHRFVVAASLVAIAGVGAFIAVAAFGGLGGAPPTGTGPVAAEDGTPSGSLPTTDPSALSLSVSGMPTGTPSLPAVPSGLPSAP